MTHMIHRTSYADTKLTGTFAAYRSILAENGNRFSIVNWLPVRIRVGECVGVAGLYRGTAMTVVRQVTTQMIRLVVFEVCRNAYASGDEVPGKMVPVWLVAGAGGLAGVISVSCTAPVDLVKTRMQGLFGSRYDSYWECFRNVWREEGAKAFYRGTGPRMVRAFIDNAFLHLFYEYNMASVQGVLR